MFKYYTIGAWKRYSFKHFQYAVEILAFLLAAFCRGYLWYQLNKMVGSFPEPFFL
jgi:hypothetical protein